MLPAGFKFSFGRAVDFYVALGTNAADPKFNNRSEHDSIRVLARLRNGVSLASARAEMQSIAAALAQQYPASNKDHGVGIVSWQEELFADSRPALWALMASVVLVLLVAAANVGNLLIARGAERSREYAIRRALGAGRRRMLQSALAESLLLAVIGGACGVALAIFALPLVLRLAPQIPRIGETAIRIPALAFTLGISIAVAVACGILPALTGWKIGPEQALKTSTQLASDGRGKLRLRSALLIAGVALTLTLTAATGSLLRSLHAAVSSDPGFSPDHLLDLDVVLEGPQYKSEAARAAFFTAAEERVRAVPGVTAVGRVMCPPLAGDCWDYFYTVPGRTAPGDYPDSLFNIADADYFRAAGIRLVAGRTFAPTDKAGSPRVAIVNQTFARKWWPNGGALGNIVRLGGQGDPGEDAQIIGVIADVKRMGLDQPVEPEVIFAAAQRPAQAMVLLARTAGAPENAESATASAIHSIDSAAPVRIHTMDELAGASLQQRRFLTVLLSVFAAIALFLAGLGIFGVAAYAVASRRAEIGLRIALGAQPAQVGRWISAQSVRRVALGCLLGLIGSSLALRLLRSQLYTVSAPVSVIDPLVLCASCLTLIAVALLATWIPARRAARIDPIRSLRAE